MDALQQDGPIVLKLNSGVMRPVLVVWAQRTPAVWGFFAGWLIVMLALYKDRSAVWGLIFVVVWHGFWVLWTRKDPQCWDVMVRALRFKWPAYLAAWPELGAAEVKVEASVPGVWEVKKSAFTTLQDENCQTDK